MAISDSAAHAPLVELRAISKAYPGTLANDQVDLCLAAGRIHALLGENGAGKSTLVKVLYGLLQPDAGSIHWQGQTVRIDNPAQARKLGIAMVFQHFSLFESLSVLENIALGMAVEATADLHQSITEVSSRYGLPLDPSRSVYTLSVGERQRIEIVRCLLQSPQVLIMDEPTSVLTPQEVADLFATLRRLAGEGLAILYISHKLDEIRQLCDEATILRGGKRVASADPATTSSAELAALMMGGEPVEITRKAASARGDVRLQVDALDYRALEQTGTSLHGVSLSVRGGEIVGIAGVAGNGQDELVRLIAGEVPCEQAEAVRLKGRPVGHSKAGARRRSGLCTIPEERLGHATVPSMTLAENAFLTAHHRLPLRQFGLASSQRSSAFAQTIIETFKVQCRGPHSLAASLSGGNLQKFIVGREILQTPEVLVVSQPTWGVDAFAARAIHQALNALAARGAAVLVVSQDIDELMSLTDRLAGLCAGRLTQAQETRSLSIRQVGLMMGGSE